MTREESLKLDTLTPIMLADGAIGVLINWYETSLGFQVSGEEEAMVIPLSQVIDIGGGALVEIPL